MKFIFVAGIVGVAIWGLVMSVQNYLVIDDLAQCTQPDYTNSVCAPADAIVAISGGDTQARADEAIGLYKKGWAPRLIFSGAAIDQSGPSNAEAMRRQAIKAGVPEDSITLDSTSVNTESNAKNTRDILVNVRRVILVTSPYHQHRAAIEFKKFFGDQVQIINHPTSTDRFWPKLWWTTPMGWWYAISETIKTFVVQVVL